MKDKVKRTNLGKRMSSTRIIEKRTTSSIERAVTDIGSGFEEAFKNVGAELLSVGEELQKDHIEGDGGCFSTDESESQPMKETISEVMAILQSLQASVQKIEEQQARWPHASEATPSLRVSHAQRQAFLASGGKLTRRRRSPKDVGATLQGADLVPDGAQSAPSTSRLPSFLRGNSRGNSRASSAVAEADPDPASRPPSAALKV